MIQRRTNNMMTVRDFEDYITNGVEIILWSVDDVFTKEND